jgi:hypothetical protein
MSSFLMRYNRRTGDLQVTEFTGEQAGERALVARVEAERTRTTTDLEVVVLTADSLEEIKQTHGRYFFTPSELLRNALSAG